MKRLIVLAMHWVLFLSLMSSCFASLSHPSPALAASAAAEGALNIEFVGNEQMTLWVSVGDPHDSTAIYTGVLTRNGTVIRQSGRSAYRYRDSGLTMGQAYTYRLRVHKNGALVFDGEQTAIAGQVQGYVAGDLTMTGEWTLHGDLRVDGALTLAPGATLRGTAPTVTAIGATMLVDHATVVSVTLGKRYAYATDYRLHVRAAVVQNSRLEADDLLIADSTLTETDLFGAIRHFEGNTGSCAATTHLWLTALPDAAVVIQNNYMPGCAVSLDWYDRERLIPPQAVSVVSNTFAALGIRGKEGAVTPTPVEIRGNTLDDPDEAALSLDYLYGKVAVTGNTLSSLRAQALTGPDTAIRSNTFSLPARDWPFALELVDSAGVVVEGNTITCLDTLNGRGIRLQNGRDYRVVDNTIQDCENGIGLDYAITNTLVMGNRITGRGTWLGLIRIFSNEGAPGTVVQENVLTCAGDAGREGGYGINLELASQVQATGNVARNCGIGLRLYGGDFTRPEFPPSTGHVLRENLLINNARSLFLHSAAQDNLIANNQFRSRVGGANFFWDESAICAGVCDNAWNRPKSAATGGNIVGGPFYGGNYWSDYAGADADGDMLGDTPYPLAAWDADELPLIGAPGPDLFVKPFSLDPARVVFAGGKYVMPVTVSVYNVGAETAEDVRITYNDNAGKSGVLYQTASLIAGAHREIAFEWDLTPILLAGQGAGQPQLTVTAVQYGPNPEGNTRNNRQSAQIGVDARPQLTAVQPLFPLTPGYYLDRTDLENPIRVAVDWNGALPGAGDAPYGNVYFDLNGAQIQAPGQAWGAEHAYNMGQDFLSSLACANNTLRIWAETPVSGGAFQSLEATLQPTVFPFPAWVEWAILNIPGAAAEFTTQISQPQVRYDYRFKYPDPAFEAKWTPPAWLPYVGGKELGIVETQAEALVSGRNDGSGRAGVGGKTGLNLAALTASGTLWGAGTARFKCGESLDLERVALGFSINLAVEKEAGIVDVVPAVKAAENAAVVGRLIRWVNQRLLVKATFTPEIAVQTEFVNQDDALVFDNGEGTGSFDLKVALDMEVIEDLKGSVYGGGKPYITLQTPAADPYGYLKEIGLDVYFGATYTAWQFEDTFERRFRCSYPGACLEVAEDGNLIPHALALAAPAAAPDWQLIPRDYLGADYARRPTFDPERARLAGGHTVTQTLVANTYPYLQPALAITGSHTLALAYVHDDPAKAHGRGAEIYAIAGSAAAAPVPLSDDAYPDFAPAVAFSGGQALALWERAALPLAITPTLDITFAQSLEIAGAVWDGGAWSAPFTLTGDSLMDHAPRLAP
ncbi:MAG: right-handed parallel beta-helix repeat-containing protein, partial [Anaerolineae bacterium]|nr:right-handed parallel beta-helix repeat-containing protein [Anaerolineae bacterium]